ncbi:MAG: SEC-C metal-binding domain-containing protein [Planctomycetota bacterium]|jgi:hypothetical protein
MSIVAKRLLRRLRVLPPIAPVPTGADVQRYMRLREASRRLADDLLTTIPRRAMDDIGGTLGILHGNTFVFDSEEISDVFTDCCLYDWIDGGRNLVRKYAEKRPSPEDPDEREVLSAMLRARFTILDVRECVPEAGVRAVDGPVQRELFLLDMGLSRSSWMEGMMTLAARILPIGEFWMTTGCALPITDLFPFALLKNLAQEDFRKDMAELLEKPGARLKIIRACMESGSAGPVRLATSFDPEDEFDIEEDFDTDDILELLAVAPTMRRAVPRKPSMNAPCPCGSGRKHKKCCGRSKRARAS